MEESKGSTSSEEPEYDSDIHSEKSIEGSRGAPKLKISLYLSTCLVTSRDQTLADITVEKYPASKIEKMESDLKARIRSIKLKPLLVDPKATLKEYKKTASVDTLVDYDKISQLCD